MDANRDEALKCLHIAEKHIKQGRKDQATKFINKAIKLDPTIDISKIRNCTFETKFSSRSRSGSRQRHRTPLTSSRNHSADNTYSDSEIKSIKKLLQIKDLYELLGVTKNASDEEIKKAYKSLARKFHPDKNKAPGATEAFKKIGSAFNILLNPEKRRKYDLYGSVDDPPASVTRQRHGDVFYQFDGHQGFDEVFNIFFTGGFPFSQANRHQNRRQHTQPQETERENNYFAYVQILPLIVLFGLSFFSNLIAKDAPFSLTRTSKYPVERLSIPNKFPYYVKTSFANDYDGSMTNLNSQIEEQYVYYLRDRCFKERNQKETLIHRARFHSDNEAFQRANRHPTPSCDRLVQFYG